MSRQTKPALNAVRSILTMRSFSDNQIEKLIPHLHEEHKRRPESLGEIIDCWNRIMGKAVILDGMEPELNVANLPVVSYPPKKSVVGKRKLNMCTILAEVEPKLLLLSPDKLVQRHQNIGGLGIINNRSEHWIALFNSPRGFYLQDWIELTKKILYIDGKVIDLLYDKREQREMDVHPIVGSAAVTEVNFDHIRARYLFAARSGYVSLSHLRKVQTARNRPSLKDMILADDETYLHKFAPFCSVEEFSCFSNLIKNHELDESDAEIYTKLAELDNLRHPTTCSTNLIQSEIHGIKEFD